MTAAYDDRPMRQTLPVTPTDRSLPGDGIRLHARDWGDGSAGRSVVLRHGLSSNARIWDGVASLLVAAGLRPVAIDQRGHGESEQPSSGYDFATVASDLSRALEALELAEPVLVGHSWGANVALHYAAERPGAVAGLALVDGAFGDVAEWAGGQQAAGKFAAIERARQALPDARVTWFEDALHDIPLQRPAELAAALVSFANEAGGRG